MSEYILELKNISKSFSGVEVLHEVSFALRPGEVHALLGENGAGKSTLVKVITGVHQPDKGEILLNDEYVHFSDARESRQAGIAAIYQELSLFPDLDVAENIFAGRQPLTAGKRVDWRKLYAEAGKLLESLGVKLDLKQKARMLSIAQQQMVEIARAFSNLHVTVEDMIAEGDVVAARLLVSATHDRGPFAGVEPTGRTITWGSFRFYRVHDGRVVASWAMQDRLGLFQQLGLIPPLDDAVHWAADQPGE